MLGEVGSPRAISAEPDASDVAGGAGDLLGIEVDVEVVLAVTALASPGGGTLALTSS
ncbi:MAG: hypothetical protein ACR2MN_04175 [Acidimicrobiales bacterium]